ncbi:hypothetical protein [Neisseria gonorrhoeae]|uniref:Phage associated protein n=1 Tax=Neisseria gonorrhoeae TaxID=485 RepID=A0AB74EQ09_NEIGO|nr:hypothetical protein [Neisseria gonorrhoeae]SCW12241.1 conserved hypothetical protein [Neisseria gonorrhoeae]
MVNEKLAENRKRYEQKRVIKKVSFNAETEKELLEYAQNLDFSQWVKSIIKKKSKSNWL